MKLVIPKGATSRIVTVFIQASNVTTGAGLGSLTNASSITGGYVREGGTGVALAVDEDVTTEGTYQAPSTAAQVRIGTPANMPTGFYELHFHNDLWATGAEAVTIGLGGASNMATLTLEVQLSDPVRGLGSPTALPNAAADAAGGLPISDAGGLDLDAKLANTHEVTAARMGALTDWINGGRLDLILDDILADTAEIGTAGAGLTALATAASLATADGKIDDILEDTGTTLPATLAMIASYIDTEIQTLLTAVADLPTNSELATALGTAADAVLAAIAALNNLSAAQVNAEVVDALNIDNYAEPTGVPSTTASIVAKVGVIHMVLVNGLAITASKKQVKDAAGNVEWEKDLADDGTTYSETAANAP